MIQKAAESDLPALAAMAAVMWESPAEELCREFGALLSDPDAQIFLKWAHGEPVGFAQCQLRHDYVEGTKTSPVGYLEGLYVAPAFQRRGYAAQLLAACERWAKEKGCLEFASDCEADNTDSILFHRAAGFAQANQVICFIKHL